MYAIRSYYAPKVITKLALVLFLTADLTTDDSSSKLKEAVMALLSTSISTVLVIAVEFGSVFLLSV